PLARVVWENDDPAMLPPPYFELVVPPGPDRLIQYAEVWDDADTGEMNFLYGDVRRSLDSGDVTVEITVNQLVSSTTKEQRLKGRYLDASGNSPTGPVQWFIVVPGGVPPIYVEDTFIY